MSDAFSGLHPRLRGHLDVLGWKAPTASQEAAIPAVLSGDHVLLVAPTGYGKTESALLPIFHNFLKSRDEYEALKKPLPKGIKVLYVTPLRALNRDMLKRTLEWGTALGITIGVRHGDTPQSERARQSRNPPDMLITTPETLQILFTGSRLREHLKTVRWVVSDEVHELAEGERGAQFSVALERLEQVLYEGRLERQERWPPKGAESTLEGHILPPLIRDKKGRETVPNGFQRIGLSATVGNPETVAGYLGGPGRDVRQVVVVAEKVYEIRVEIPEVAPDDDALSRRILAEPAAAALIRRVHDLFESHEATLFFSNTRDGAEIIGTRFHLWRPDYPLGVHHGSLSRDIRIEMEDTYKRGELKALVCTSSLELGIDVGQTDLVIQLNSPRGVERMIQRLGRAGHRAGDISKGVVLCTSPEEFLEAAVIARRVRERKLPPIVARPAPLEVLANQLISITQEYRALDIDWFHALVRRTQAFHDLPRPALLAVVGQLAGQRSLWYEEEKGWFGPKGASRRYFHDNISMIPDARSFKVVDVSTRRSIGRLDEAFVLASLTEGAHFILRGRPWMVAEIQEDAILVAPVKDVGNVPNWHGEDLPVRLDVALEVGRLRGRLAEGDIDAVMAEYDADAYGIEEVLKIIRRQKEKGLVVPSETTVTVETTKRVTMIIGAWGTQVNETLGRLFSALLAARRGASVGLTTDAYRIILEAPEGVSPEDILALFLDTDPETLPDLMRLSLKNSNYVKWQLVHVARKFGALSKELDPSRFSMRTLLERFSSLPVFDEALDKLLWERMDVSGAQEILRRIQDGRIDIHVQRLSPIGRMGLESRRDLMAPERADRTILDALKKRLLESQIALRCTNCGHQWSTRVERCAERPTCAKCGAILIAASSPWREEGLKLVRKTGRTPEEEKEARRLYKGANLVATYGRDALMVLVARGVGPDAAARILGRMHDDPYQLLRDILEAELTYARTRGFWD
ncbi:MAG: DEAD/DEAH box helicase [Euryarchaeota archaeon]|nr:DEAD/DEAH box helicase [Euryarchaeota archaeon]